MSHTIGDQHKQDTHNRTTPSTLRAPKHAALELLIDNQTILVDPTAMSVTTHANTTSNTTILLTSAHAVADAADVLVDAARDATKRALATQPAIALGLLRIKELDAIDGTPNRAPLCAKCLKPVAYGGRIRFRGPAGVGRACARPAGVSVGSASWCIDGASERVVYLASGATPSEDSAHSSNDSAEAAVAPAAEGIGGCQPAMLSSEMLGANVLITGEFRAANTAPPADALKRILHDVYAACMRGESVLLPRSAACGDTLVLVEALAAMLEVRLPTRPVCVCFVSPVAALCVAVSDTLSEWLEPERQQRSFAPELPYRFEELAAKGRLIVAESIEQLCLGQLCHQSCIFVAADASLRHGTASLQLLQILRHGGAPALLMLTEPSTRSFDELLAPSMPLGAVSVCAHPLDCRADATSTVILVERLRPKLYLGREPLAPAASAVLDAAGCASGSLSSDEWLAIPPTEGHTIATMGQSLADSLHLRQLVGGSLNACRVRLQLSRVSQDDAPELTADRSDTIAHDDVLLLGEPRAESLCAVLTSRGKAADIEEGELAGHLVIVTQGARIILEPGHTRIESEDFDLALLLEEMIEAQLLRL